MMKKRHRGVQAKAPALSLPRYRKPGVSGLRIDAEVGNSRLRMGEETLTSGIRALDIERRGRSLSREAGEGWRGDLR